MAGFNSKTKTKTIRKAKQTTEHPAATTNHAGGLAFTVSPKLELIRLTTAGFLGEAQHYQPNSDARIRRIIELANEVDQSFLLKLANFVRNKMKIRTAAMLLAVLGAKAGTDGAMTRAYIPKIATRADEPGEILAAYMALYGQGQKLTKAPRALLKGLSDAIGGFNEHQLAKYKGGSKGIKLRDVFRLVRPVPKDEEQSALYRKVVKDELGPAETWESEISANGSTAETWNQIAPKMGLMALIRNLRNFEQKGAKEAIDIAVRALQDKDAVLGSKQLPFRFLSALHHVESNRLKDALRVAIELSVQNLPHWPGKTAIFVDVSASMTQPVSKRSAMTCRDVATVMGSIACHLCEDYIVGAFASSYTDVDISKRDSILTNEETIRRALPSGGTYAYLCIDRLIKAKERVDRVVILSDEQTYGHNLWSGTSVAERWVDYKAIAPSAKLITLNLAGYSTAHTPEDRSDVMQLSGWSESIFDFVALSDNEDAMIREIEANW